MVGAGNPAAVASMRHLGSGGGNGSDAALPSRLSESRASRTGPRHSVYWVQSQRTPSSSTAHRKSSTTVDMGAGEGQIEYTVTGKYTGDWLDGRKHGYGVFIYANGSKYEGEWIQDKRDGKGTQWVGGGGSGSDKLKAKGKLNAKAHKQYAGAWRDDKRHGMGTFFFEDGGRYDGLWERNKREGAGRMVYADQSVYEGQWHKNERSGQGMLQLSNGDRYEGHWLSDKKEGPGRFYYQATRKIYEGEWVDGTPRCGTYLDDTHARTDDSEEEDGDEEDNGLVFKPHNRFQIPELGLAHPERVLSESIASIHQERILEMASQSTRFHGRAGEEDPDAGGDGGASVVFDEPTMRFLQHEFQSLERRDCTIPCESLPHMFDVLGLRVDNEQILAFLDEIGATPETAITFAECVDILSLLAESAIGVEDARPQTGQGEGCPDDEEGDNA